MGVSAVVRVVCGAVLGAAFAGIVFGLLTLNPLGLQAAFIVALAHALLGLFVYAVLRCFAQVTLLRTLIVGFLVGAVPFGLLAALSDPPHSATMNGVQTAIAGQRTLAGWISIVSSASMLGAFGAAAAFVFWLTIRSLPEAMGRTSLPRPKFAIRQVAVPISLAVAAIVAIPALPVLLKDRSCHNPLRDGRRSINAEANIELDIEPAEWSTVFALIDSFGGSHRWSVRKEENGLMQPSSISVCTDAGTQIYALRLGVGGSPSNGKSTTRFYIAVYQPQGGESWKAPAGELVDALSAQFPGRVGFRGPRGERIPVLDLSPSPATP